MRDDTRTGKVNLGGPAARRYHRMTSRQAMKPGWKTQAYIDAAAEVTGQQRRKAGFKNKSFAATTAGRKLGRSRAGESAAWVVDKLLNG